MQYILSILRSTGHQNAKAQQVGESKKVKKRTLLSTPEHILKTINQKFVTMVHVSDEK